MVDQMRRDRDTNLGYNSFTPKQFAGILRSSRLEMGPASKERVTFCVGKPDKSKNHDYGRQGNTVAASPSSGAPPVPISTKEYLSNQLFNKKGAYLQTKNMPSYEPLAARHQYKAIGWGTENAKIDHSLTN